MRQLLEAISTRDRLRAFWQRNLVTIAMLRRNLPDLKTDKGEHYADILTSLYKQQMRLIWEETKTYERRAREIEERQEARRELDQETVGTNVTVQVSSGAGEQRPAREDAEATHLRPNKPQDSGERQFEHGDHRNGDRAAQSGGIGADRKLIRQSEKRNSGGDSTTDGGRIDKSILPITTPRRVRDKEHLRYVASQPCIICGRSPGHAHHLRFAQPRALGRKVGDDWTVPLCVTHHRALHRVGDEESWWEEKRINATAHAVLLWRDTKHGGVENENKIAGPECNVVIDGRDGPPGAGKQIGPSVPTAGRKKDRACER